MTDVKTRLAKIPPGTKQRVSANVDASLYNELVDISSALDQEFSWLVRVSLKKFVRDHRDAVLKDPVQLVLDLTHI